MHLETRDAASGLLFQLREELDRWLGAVRGGNGTWVPAVDLYEEDGELHLEVELPGVEATDVEILTEGQELTIRALSSDPRTPKEADLLERRRGTFERTLNLPFGWDGIRSRADFHNGVLTLRVPRAAEPEKARRISLGGASIPPVHTGRSAGPFIPGEKEKLATKKDEHASNGGPRLAEPALAPMLVGGPLGEDK